LQSSSSSPFSDVVPNWIPSPASPILPATHLASGASSELTGRSTTIQHVPIVNSDEASIVTVNADGTTTVDKNNATTAAADLSTYTKGFLSRVTFGANGTITAYSSLTALARSESNALDVTA
jgi:hypothetical protein